MPRPPTGPSRRSTAVTSTGLFRSSVYIPLEVHDQLRQLAHEQRTTISALIGAAIEEVYGPPPPRPLPDPDE